MTTSGHDRIAGASVDECTTVPDPPPVRPLQPLPYDCCESGCPRCVFEIYADELAAYHSALIAWRARNPGRAPEG